MQRYRFEDFGEKSILKMFFQCAKSLKKARQFGDQLLGFYSCAENRFFFQHKHKCKKKLEKEMQDYKLYQT